MPLPAAGVSHVPANVRRFSDDIVFAVCASLSWIPNVCRFCFARCVRTRIYESVIVYSTHIYPSIQSFSYVWVIDLQFIDFKQKLLRLFFSSLGKFIIELFGRFEYVIVDAAAWRKWIETCGGCPLTLINIYLIVGSVSSYMLLLSDFVQTTWGFQFVKVYNF